MDTTAYLAGLFDGAGTFSIQIQQRGEKVTFAPKMTLVLSKSNLADHVQTFLGGNIYEKNGKFRWVLSRKEELVRASRILDPYLIAKKETCGEFRRALSIFPEDKWTDEAILEVARIALSLNRSTEEKEREKEKVLQGISSLCLSVDAVIKQ